MKYSKGILIIVSLSILGFVAFKTSRGVKVPEKVKELKRESSSTKVRESTPAAGEVLQKRSPLPSLAENRARMDERIAEILREMEQLDRGALKEVIRANQAEINERHLIQLANSDSLNAKERDELAMLMTRVSVAKLTLINKELDIDEAAKVSHEN